MFNLKLLRELESRSPAVVQNLILVNTRSLVPGKITMECISDGVTSAIGGADLERPVPSIKERLVRVAERFGREKPSIVYANGPADAESVAKGLADIFEEIETSERVRDLIGLAKAAVHSKYDLASCLGHGIAFHYGRIPALIRRGIETAFSDGEIRYLVTTSTLIQGVNFPAANLFVCKPKKGQHENLDPGEFWNLAGRAGRLGKEFQGNIFLIDYQDWEIKDVDQPSETEIRSSIGQTLQTDLAGIIACAEDENPPLESEARLSLEATFARLLSDYMAGILDATLDRHEVEGAARSALFAALEAACKRITLPPQMIGASPTVSPVRQQRLANYLVAEIRGGGVRRLSELTPCHPRDEDAYLRLAEVFKICHRQLLSLNVPRLHSRMAAIAVRWMRGDPLPEIVDENHKRSGGANIARSIRETLKDIEQEIRFKYLRLTMCYVSVLTHVLSIEGHSEVAARLPNLPSYLEVGASDQTMVSFIGAGISRVTARSITESAMDKNMDLSAALSWLRGQNIDSLLTSPLMRDEVDRALRNNA